MIGTYRGVIDKDHYFYNKDDIAKEFQKEMYGHAGKIEQTTFDEFGVVHDNDLLG